MNWEEKPHDLGLWRQTKGSISIEFAVLGTLFLLIFAGIIDFGHAWFMKQVVTNASREGARYGITYQTDANGVRKVPNAFTPTIANYVLNTSTQNSGKGGYGLLTLLPSNANPTVTLAGTGYTTGNKGTGLEVTVTATKTWLVVSGFIPGLGTQTTLTAKSVMLCE